MELSENEQYPDALVLLHKVVRDEPNHFEAQMEIRRIAEINRDAPAYTKSSAAVLDIVIRQRDWDLLYDLYKQYQESPLHQLLPPRTLFGIASAYEENQEYQQAASLNEDLIEHYPEDALAMKALSKLSRLYLERLNNRDRGIELFWRSYHHPLATDQWRSALQTDLKKYDIPLTKELEETPISLLTLAATPAARNDQQSELADLSSPVAEQRPVKLEPKSYASRIEPAADSESRLSLPHVDFDGCANDSWIIVPCKIEKIILKGMELCNSTHRKGFLAWKRIQFLSVGRIRIINPATSQPEKNYLVIDLISQDPANLKSLISYRMLSNELPLGRIFPKVEQTFEEAFQNFIGIIINNSGARCMPNQEACQGPNFATYPDISRYDTRVRDKILSL